MLFAELRSEWIEKKSIISAICDKIPYGVANRQVLGENRELASPEQGIFRTGRRSFPPLGRRSSLGEEIFDAQFQQRPVRPEGAI